MIFSVTTPALLSFTSQKPYNPSLCIPVYFDKVVCRVALSIVIAPSFYDRIQPYNDIRHGHGIIMTNRFFNSQQETQELRRDPDDWGFSTSPYYLRRYYKHKQILTYPYRLNISNRFRKYCAEKDYSSVIIDHYVK